MDNPDTVTGHQDMPIFLLNLMPTENTQGVSNELAPRTVPFVIDPLWKF